MLGSTSPRLLHTAIAKSCSSPYLACVQQHWGMIQNKAAPTQSDFLSAEEELHSKKRRRKVTRIAGTERMKQWKGRGGTSPGNSTRRYMRQEQKDTTYEARTFWATAKANRETYRWSHRLEADGNLLLCELKVQSKPERHKQPSVELTHYSFWWWWKPRRHLPTPKVLTLHKHYERLKHYTKFYKITQYASASVVSPKVPSTLSRYQVLYSVPVTPQGVYVMHSGKMNRTSVFYLLMSNHHFYNSPARDFSVWNTNAILKKLNEKKKSVLLISTTVAKILLHYSQCIQPSVSVAFQYFSRIRAFRNKNSDDMYLMYFQN